jgi:hypothetical protein
MHNRRRPSRAAAPHALAFTTFARLALCAGALGSVDAAAQAAPQITQQPCASVRDPNHLGAIAAAEAWRDARWASQGRRWSTAYEVPPPPKAPLGIGAMARGQELGAVEVPTSPIVGIASVSQLNCTTAAADPAGTYIVQFIGRGLRFKENSEAWSRPLRTSLLHVLVVARPTADVTWTISEPPEARTALIPGARLSPPAPAGTATLALAKARPRR